MLIEMESFTAEAGRFSFHRAVRAKAHQSLHRAIFQQLWQGFCAGLSSIDWEEDGPFFFGIGESADIEPGEHDYAIAITERGVSVAARNETFLKHGFMSLLGLIQIDCTEPGRERFSLPCGRGFDKGAVGVRMLHLCVFPETTLDFVQKTIRACGVLKYTHLVLEFWGMYRFRCLKELSWPHGYTYEEIAPLLREAVDMGMELVPIWNHFGHASAGRVAHGKHVVLDQNPAHAPYFTPDGWCWNIHANKTKKLLKSIRAELYELFGHGQYLHIGCDEAYTFGRDTTHGQAIGQYLAQIIAEVKAEGRTPILWGDMLLRRADLAASGDENTYMTYDFPEKTRDEILAHIDKDVLIADWQYDAKHAPVRSSKFFTDRGYPVALCPWYDFQNQAACAQTAIDGQMPVMVTTWHTLSVHMPSIINGARLLYRGSAPNNHTASTDMAALVRKVFFAGGDYAKAGWSKYQVADRT
ncbi:MAG: family 20 glycosylhydrolase [Eubacteriales bacterium]